MIGLLIFLPATTEKSALARSCVEDYESEANRLETHDAVFVGEISEWLHTLGADEEKTVFVKVRLEQYWKGFSKDKEFVPVLFPVKPHMAASSAFETNASKWLFYADDAKGLFIIRTCSGPIPLDEATAELMILGPGTIAGNRTDVPTNYLREFEISYEDEGATNSISGVSISAVPTSVVMNPDGVTTLEFQDGARGIVVINMPNELVDGIYGLEIDDERVADEFWFAEASSTNSTRTIHAYLPPGAESVQILNKQAMIHSGRAMVLTGVSSENTYEAEITWKLSEGYRKALFEILIFDAEQPEPRRPIGAHYDTFLYRGNSQLLSLDQWRMTEPSVISKVLSLPMQNGSHVISIENINGSNESIDIPFTVTPEFPVALVPMAFLFGLVVTIFCTRVKFK